MNRSIKRIPMVKAKLTQFFVVLFFLLVPVLSNAQVQQPRIKVGDVAPTVKVGKWIKGNSIGRYDPNYIYIVEFSGVGCGPCRASIPMLSELARKYRSKVRMVSVYVLENGSNPPKDTVDTAYMETVERYINKIQDDVAFDVAVDDPTQTMFNTWLKPSGSTGIPRVFIVNRAGNIAWIGGPRLLEQELKHLLDDEDGARKNETVLGVAVSHLDNDTHISEDFSQNLFLYRKKLKELLDKDEKQAYEYGWKLLANELKNVEPVLFYMARDLHNRQISKQLSSPQQGFDLALALSERAAELCKAEFVKFRILRLQAEMFMNMNDPENAIAKLKLAFAELKPYESNKKYREEMEKITQELDKYSADF